MIGNLQNIDKNKKEKLINFTEIVKKIEKKKKKKKIYKKKNFQLRLKI